jgi:hypothetical protein
MHAQHILLIGCANVHLCVHRSATNITGQEGKKRIPPGALGAGSFRCFEMADFGDAIYRLGCAVAAVLFVLGIVDHWLGQGFGAFMSWVLLSAITWVIGYAVRYALAGR